MRAMIALVAAAVVATGSLATASAQPAYGYDGGWRPADTYGRYDPCAEAKHDASVHGAVTDGILGAFAGAMLGGRGSRGGGALVGGAVGAVAGSQIARSNVRCISYPYGYRPHPHCHWIDDHGHGVEVCRMPDGYWRPWRPGY